MIVCAIAWNSLDSKDIVRNTGLFYSNSIMRDSIKEYYELINAAELCIINNNNKEAILNYSKAFKYINQPFPEDIYNYILLNTYIGDYNEALKYSENLVRLGVELKFFDQVPLNRLKNYESGWKTFCDKYPALRLQYTFSINHGLKEELKKLTEADQANYCGQTIRPSNPLSEDSICNRLGQIILQYGYPNHEVIGVNLKNDTILVPLNHEVILFHLFQTKNKNSKLISNLLINEVYKGNLKPENAISWIEYMYQPEIYYGIFCFSHLNSEIFGVKYSFENCNYHLFDKRRQDIFAPILKESLSKSIFKLNNPNSKFIFKSVYIQDLPFDPFNVFNEKIFQKLDINNIVFDPSNKFLDSIFLIKNILTNNKLQNYYVLINKAEMSICKYNYKKAIKLYTKAFKQIEIPFPKDIYNVILTAIYCEDFKTAFKYSEQLIKLGANINFFNQEPLKQLISHRKQWNKFINSYPDNCNYYKSNFDLKLKRKIENLNFQCKQIWASSDFRNSINNNSVFNQFFELIIENGYPSQNKIGITVSNDTVITAPESVLILYSQFRKDTIGISNLLLKELYKGNISQNEYLNTETSLNNAYYKFGIPVLKKYNGEYFILNSDDEKNSEFIKRIAKNRKNIMYSTVEDEIKKSLFLEKNKKLKFRFNIGQINEISNILPYQNSTTYKKIDLNDY